MTFSEQLLFYVEQIGATFQELAGASGLGISTISRYCSGARTPKRDSAAIQQLVDGIASLAAKRGLSLTRKEILSALLATLDDGISIGYDDFLVNLRELMKQLDVRIGDVARALNYDASYVSKILSGDRRPRDLKAFIEGLSAYIARHFVGTDHISRIARLVGAEPEALTTAPMLDACLISYLGSTARVEQEPPLSRFLTRIDDFDMRNYPDGVLDDMARVPSAAPALPERKEYIGIEQMMQSELDFIKATLLSPSTGPCFLFSDMPIEGMASDWEFSEKYIAGMIGMLKKGLHLHIIHDIHRPFAEMMLGLENYIPLYMTGQISPYYLPKAQNDVFCHLLKVSDAAALEGIAVNGKQAEGKYVLYCSKAEVEHYRARADAILKKARPLMDVYTQETRDGYIAVLERAYSEGDCESICNALPVYFLPEEKLERLLSSAVPAETELILSYASRMRSFLESFLQKNRLHLVLPELTGEQYAASPLNLSLADLFIAQSVALSYECYLGYMEEVKRLAERFSNLIVEFDPAPAFRNINISIFLGGGEDGHRFQTKRAADPFCDPSPQNDPRLSRLHSVHMRGRCLQRTILSPMGDIFQSGLPRFVHVVEEQPA